MNSNTENTIKPIFILADHKFSLVIKKELISYFPKVIANPTQSDLDSENRSCIILDFINYSKKDEAELLRHNSLVLKKILDFATRTDSKLFFAYNIKDKKDLNNSLNLAKSFIREFSNHNNLVHHFVELPDIYGPQIITSKILEEHLRSLITTSRIRINNDMAPFNAVYEEDFYEGILNFIIHELNSVGQKKGSRIFTIVPVNAITEIELAHFIKDLVGDNVQITYRSELNSRPEDKLEVDQNAIKWIDRISLEEGLKSTLLALDIPVKIANAMASPIISEIIAEKSPDVKQIVQIQPITEAPIFANYNPVHNIEPVILKTDNISEIYLEELQKIEEAKVNQKNNINYKELEEIKSRLQEVRLRESNQARENFFKQKYESIHADKSKKKKIKTKGRFKTTIPAILLFVFFSFIVASFSTVNYVYNLYSAALTINKSLDNLAKNNFQDAYHYSDKALVYLKDPAYPYLLSLFLNFDDRVNPRESFASLSDAAEAVKNISYIKQSLAEDINKESKVLGATTRENYSVYLDRTIEILDSLDQDQNIIAKETYFYDHYYKYPLSKVQNYRNYLVNLKNVVANLDETLGYDSKKKYLLIIQDDSDIQPSGGKIVYLAEINIEKGKLNLENFVDSKEFDKILIDNNINIIPPLAIRKAFNVDRILLEHANFNPDLQEFSNNILSLYKDAKDVYPNGAIILNKQFFINYLKKDSDFDIYKKDEVKNLSEKFIAEYINDKEDLNSSVDFIFNELNSKNLIVYSKSSAVNAGFLKNNWGGSLNDIGDDYVYAIDADMSETIESSPLKEFNKYTKKSIFMEANKIEDKLIRKLILDYKFEPPSKTSTGYLDHIRVILPADIKILDAKISVDGVNNSILRNIEIYPYQNKTIVAFDTTIKPSSDMKIIFEYGSNIEKQKKSINMYVQSQPRASGYATFFVNKDLLNPSTKFPKDFIKNEYDNRISLTKKFDADITVEIPL